MGSSAAPRSQLVYQPLPPGSNGLSREQVAADQRGRLERAMIDAVACHGYAATTVRDVVARARVSKSTFYEHFASREACVREAYDEVVSDGAERVAAAYRSREGWHDRLRAAFEEFMAIIASDPGAARLVIVEALALGEGAVAHREPAARAFELLLRQSFDHAPGAGRVADTTIAALVGGMRRLVYTHLHQDTAHALSALVDELPGWALTYQLPGGRAGRGSRRSSRARRGTA